MKQQDILLVVVVGIFAGIFALVLSVTLLPSPDNLQQNVEVVEPISTEFGSPSEKYFHEDSINPTQLIDIDNNKNPNPFQ